MLGEVIHGYRVDRALSVDKGGMGDVFFATHVESGADAVVKVLKPEMSARRDIVTRFFNEARAAASIHHPGIVQIHNVGYHGDRAYLLMERLRGDDLENRLKAGPLPLDRAIVFLRQATGAIAAAHERGIVHRDLKPANLFVVPDPDVIGGERVKVLDFGIAKLSLDTGGNKTQGIFGTPAYMSPEQCASSGDVDARSDLYALGCIFYELVTGRPPFGPGGIELVAAHLRDMPPPPRTFAPWLPPAVEAIILQLLEKQPARRLPSCAALIAALDGVAATVPPGASPSVPPALGAAPHSMPPIAAHAGAPQMASYPPSTLSNAAGAMATQPAAPRNRNVVWIGLALVAAAAMILAAVVATSSGSDKKPDIAAGGSDLDAAVTPPPPPPAVDAGAAPLPPPAGDRKEQARELNETAKAAMFDRRYTDAIDLFTRAIALDPSPELYFNLAVARYQAGHCAEAKLALQEVLADGGRASSELREKARKMSKQVGDCAPKGPVATNDPKPQPQPQPQPQPDPKPTPTDPKPTPPDPKPTPPDPTPTPGGDAAARADELNEYGKELMRSASYSAAAENFRQAIVLDPLPKYYFNLGVAQFQLGKCGDAVRSMDHILQSGAPQALKEKARKLKDKASAC